MRASAGECLRQGRRQGHGGPSHLKVVAGLLVVLAAVAFGGAAIYLYSDGKADAGGLDIRLTPTARVTRTPAPGTPGASATPTPGTAEKFVPWSYPAAAGPGVMSAECNGKGPNSVKVFLLWNASGAGIQYLDFSVQNNGFAAGTFLSFGPFGRDGWGYAIEGVRQDTTHIARLNTWTGTRWAPSYPLQFRTPICDASAAEPSPRADMLALRDRLGGTIYNSGINAAMAITDLQTGETIDVNGTDPRLPGCTLNLFVIMWVVQELQAGTVAERDAGDIIAQTINRSDPILARRMLRDWVGDNNVYRGLDRMNVYLQALGMTSTIMDHPPAFPEESLHNDVSFNNSTTARDANKALRTLWDGGVVSPQWRDYLLQKMTLVKPGLQYIIGSAGYGATRSHKNGFLYEQGWADDDIGIVWFERGGKRYGYAISFYSQYLRGKYDAIPLAQNVAAIAYDWFAARYGAP